MITVGASEGVRPVGGSDGCGVSDAQANHAGDLLGISSRGPTQDGRLKPDLVAPGSHVTGAAPTHSGYTRQSRLQPHVPLDQCLPLLSSGTSQAAPHVSGAAALIRDWYPRETGDPPPSPAMTKAILMNAASDLAGQTNGKGDPIAPGPNNDQGWGRVNVGAALDSTERVYLDQPERRRPHRADRGRVAALLSRRGSGVGRSRSPWSGPIPRGRPAGNAFVNNLDLVVEAGGRSYKGNVFGGGTSVPGGAADPRNNVESVFLRPGTSGRFSVKVVGTNVPGDGVPGNGDDAGPGLRVGGVQRRGGVGLARCSCTTPRL